MARAVQLQGNFTSGELSPRLLGRPDVQRFFSGGQVISNFDIKAQGGLFRRMGTRFLGTIRDAPASSNNIRLVPFEFSDVQAYILELGPLYMRIWKDGILQSASFSPVKSITGITQANPMVVSSAAHGLANGTRIVITGVTGMTEVNNREFVVANAAAGTFECQVAGTNVNSTNYTAYSAGGEIKNPVVVTTPWADADLPDIDWAQSADVLFVTHPNHRPREIRRTSDVDWTIAIFDHEFGPYLDENEDESEIIELIVKFGGRAVAFSATNANPAVITIDTNTSATYHRGLAPAELIFEANDRVYVSGATGSPGGTEWETINGKFYRVQNPTVPSGTPNQGDIELVDEVTGVAFDSSGFTDTLDAGTMNICHADTVADAEDISGNNHFTAAAVHSATEYVDGRIHTQALQMDRPTSPSNTAKVQTWDHICKLDVPRGSEISGAPLTVGAVPATTTASFADVFDKESDVGRLVRATDITTDFSVSPPLFARGAPFTGGGAWPMITSFDAGDLVKAKLMGTDVWSNGYGTAITPTFPQHVYIGGRSSGEHTLVVSNKQFKGRLRASSARFASTDIGRWVRLRFGDQIVHAQIEHFISTTEVRVDLDSIPDPKYREQDNVNASGFPDIAQTVKRLPFFNNGITDKWALGAWYDGLTNGKANWPSLVAFHQQRLVFARTQFKPQTIWMSQIDDFNNFATEESDTTVLDSNAINFTVASQEINAIKWLSSGPVLLIGSLAAEWQVKPSSISEPITPTNIVVQIQTEYGGLGGARAVNISNGTFFLERNGKRMREMRFSFELDRFTSRDVTVLSEHILRGLSKASGAPTGIAKAVRMTYQRGSKSILWVLLDNGALRGVTYEPEQEVLAWFQFTTGVTSAIFPFIEDIASIPNADGSDFDLYLVVRRQINGASRYYMERVEPDFEPASDTVSAGMAYADCFSSAINGVANVVHSLEHLEGETVIREGDGLDEGNATVTNGEVAITGNSRATVGIPYISECKTMPLEGGSPFGSAQGATKRVSEIIWRVKDSVNLEYRQSGDLNKPAFKEIGTLASSKVTQTGFIRERPNVSTDREAVFEFRQTRPLPLNVLALVFDFGTDQG